VRWYNAELPEQAAVNIAWLDWGANKNKEGSFSRSLCKEIERARSLRVSINVDEGWVIQVTGDRAGVQLWKSFVQKIKDEGAAQH
jgi:hypothetical protein